MLDLIQICGAARVRRAEDTTTPGSKQSPILPPGSLLPPAPSPPPPLPAPSPSYPRACPLYATKINNKAFAANRSTNQKNLISQRLKNGSATYASTLLYPVIGTWGFVPVARTFAEFRKWYYSLDRTTFKPYVDGVLPTDRYKRISSKTSMQNAVKHIWSKYHVKYTDAHEDKYTVYVNCKNGAALAISYEEPGRNDSVGDALAAGKNTEAQPPPLLTEWDVELLGFSANLVVLTYNGTSNATASHA
jgi:hypothetical protein